MARARSTPPGQRVPPGLLLHPFAVGPGFEDRIIGRSPAAGSAFTLSLSAGGNYPLRLLSARFVLATSATVANRVATVQHLNADGTVLAESGAAVFQTASQTHTYQGQATIGQSEWNETGADSTPVFFPLSPVFFLPGDSVRVNVAQIDAGDQLSGVVLIVERFELPAQ